MSALPHWHSYMQTWVPLCGTVCVLQSSHVWSHTLVRMCMCISPSDSQYHLKPLCIVTWKHGFSVWHFACPSHPASSPTPCLECVHASVHVFIPLLVPHLGYTHTNLSNYRHVYLHHVKSGLHAINIKANKNTSYFFASQKRNNLQLELRGFLGMEVLPPNRGVTSGQKWDLQSETLTGPYLATQAYCYSSFLSDF